MKYSFELYVNKDQITKKDFVALYNTASSYTGLFSKLRFHIKLSDNNVRYFIESTKDLGAISGSINFGILRPVPAEEITLPQKCNKEKFFSFVKGGSLIDLHEKISVKRAKSLDHFVCDAVRITEKKAKIDIKLYFKNVEGNWSKSTKIGTSFPAHLFAVDFKKATNFMKKELPKYLNIEKTLTWLSQEKTNAVLEIDTFPYTQNAYFLGLGNYEFDKHSMIVGASGSGKSKFIELLIDRINKLPNRNDYRIAVIDPHASMSDSLQQIVSAEQREIVDFGNDSAELFAGAEADITASTELTTSLFKSLMGKDWNSRVERVLRFSLFVLFTAKSMSMGSLKRFLVEIELRQQILSHVEGHVPNNIIQFFNTDYNEIRTAHYNDGLLPIISLIDEMELQPTFLAEGGLSIQKSINDKFLTVFSLNKVSMGEKVVKTVAGLLIQQIFLLAQAKSFNQKVLLFIDEVSIVQTPVLASILSEARKYNLFVYLTQQYFNQVDKTLRDSVFANVTNYYAFRVSEEDANLLVGNMPMELPKELAINSKDEGLKQDELKARFLTEQSPRQCIVRISAGGQLLPSFKATTIDVSHDSSLQNTTGYNPVVGKRKPGPSNALKPFKESAPVSVDEFLENAESQIDYYQENPSYDTIPKEGVDNEEYTDEALTELLKKRSPEAFTKLEEKAETLDSNTLKKLSGEKNNTTVDTQNGASFIAPTIIRFAMSGVPVVDRGMPDLETLLRQESTKANV